MGAVHQHLRLNDRHDAGLLAKRRVAGESVSVRPEAITARPARPRSRSPRATSRSARRAPCSSARRSRRPSRPSVTFSPSAPASGLAPVSTLIPGIMPRAASRSGKARTVGGRLADRLVAEDHTADVGLGAGRGHEQLAKAQAGVRRSTRPRPTRGAWSSWRCSRLRPGCRVPSATSALRRRLERLPVLGHVPTPLPSTTSRTEPSAITIDSVYASPSDDPRGAQQRASSDAGCSEKAPTAHQLVHFVDALTVQARFGDRPRLVVALGREAPLHPAADALCGACRHQAFGGTADAHQEIRLTG